MLPEGRDPQRTRAGERLAAALRRIALACLASTLAPLTGLVSAQSVPAPVAAVPAAAGPSDRNVPETARQARLALYPAYDDATRLTGETFRSPSLSRQAPDMRLADFDLVAVPRRAQGDAGGLFVVAGLLKPIGFPPSYTLVEVALVQRGPSGLALRANLKVRVDSGEGDGRLTMALQPAVSRLLDSGSDRGRLEVRFDVLVSEAADRLRHRFRIIGDRIELIESLSGG